MRVSGRLLELTIKEVERVLSSEQYIVIEPGTHPMSSASLSAKRSTWKGSEKYGATFIAGIGAEAMRECLKIQIEDLTEES